MKKTRDSLLLFTLSLMLCLILALAGCSMPGASPEAASEATPDATAAPTPEPSGGDTAQADAGERYTKVEIKMQDGGVILLELDAEVAPVTVENFVKLVNEGFYDGLTFHRIDPTFVIQGGDPDGTGRGGPGYGIYGEFSSNGWNNSISHVRGTVSMARSGQPDSAGSQFFITLVDAGFLDGDYAAFGKVIEGMDVVDAIAAVPTQSERPLTDVIMETVRVVE